MSGVRPPEPDSVSVRPDQVVAAAKRFRGDGALGPLRWVIPDLGRHVLVEPFGGRLLIKRVPGGTAVYRTSDGAPLWTRAGAVGAGSIEATTPKAIKDGVALTGDAAGLAGSITGYDADSGEFRWCAELAALPSAVVAKTGDPATVVVVGRDLQASKGPTHLAAVNTRNGSVLWSREIPDELRQGIDTGMLTIGDRVVAGDGRVALVSAGKLAVYDLRTGEEVARTAVTPGYEVLGVRAGRVVLHNRLGGKEPQPTDIAVYDLKGSEVFRVEGSGTTLLEAYLTPSLLVVNKDGRHVAYRLADGAKAWSVAAGTGSAGVAAGGRIYVPSADGLSIIDPTDGTHRTLPLPTANAQPIVAGGRLLLHERNLGAPDMLLAFQLPG